MNADPFRDLPTQEDYAADLSRWPDMAQMEEPRDLDAPTGNAAGYALIFAAITVAVILLAVL